MNRPRLKAHLSPQVLGDRVFLITEDRHYVVQGGPAVQVLAFLDGRHTLADIVEKLDGALSFAGVLGALAKYQRFGHLADGRPDLPEAQLAAWDARGLDPETAVRALAAAPVAVVTAGEVDPAPFLRALAAAGLPARQRAAAEIATEAAGTTDATAAELVLVLCDDYLDDTLGALDDRLRAAGRSWLLVKPIGDEVWLGPLFVPDPPATQAVQAVQAVQDGAPEQDPATAATGCWHCLAARLEGNRPVEQYLRTWSTDGTRGLRRARAATAASVDTAAGLVAALLTELAGTGRVPSVHGTLVSLDSRTLATERHAVVRRPQCPHCGDARLLLDRLARIELASSAVNFATDGGHRTVRPEDTQRRLDKHVSRITGVITHLQLLNGTDNGVTYSYFSGHNFAVAHNLDALRRNVRGISGGKGRTEVQAKVSAMCEAVERYSGVWRDDRPTITASYAQLGPERAVPMAELLLFSEKQHREAAAWNRTDAGRLQQVPQVCPDGTEIAWTAAWSLTEERERLVPAVYAWFGHPDLYDFNICFTDGNGHAAGNTLPEAILQGFCELVERDAVSLWWYNRIARPGFDLDSLNDPYITTLREHYASIDREVWVLDITTDLGIPTFVAVSRRTDRPVEDVILGFGAHLDPRIAVVRALTEANQFLPSVTMRKPDGSTFYWEEDPQTLEWLQNVRVAEEPWLLPHPGLDKRRLTDYPELHTGDAAQDVRNCVELVREHGHEFLVVDQSLPDIELHVAKVIVPGLRHFWRRLGAGRLYDAPVRLGWIDQPVAEEDLNPRSVFF
ncbi:TOMM precursor leader peptide-binding protein [Kitasatospora nipponensis]|uniref:TOMM leader peptide-binding protein n=1 Tax=Kitasatospora nipponensis TaxID=258049 RepID=A0ABN1WUN6_9ACTN